MKKYIKIILFLITLNIIGITNVYAGNPYYQQGPYGTNCTWYAWNKAYEKGGVSLPGFGNAKDWYNNAANAGYTIGTTPQANSIIVWGSWTEYGHVGYVEKVEGNIMYIWDSSKGCIDESDPVYQECMANSVSEETDRECKKNAKYKACEYPISPDNYGLTGFIYLNYPPQAPVYTPETNPEVKEEPKSSNAYLSKIELSEGKLSFNKDTYEYTLEVENEVDSIIVNATLEDKKATLEGNKEYELNNGLNEIKLIVTAEDGTKKEYIIKVTRKEKIEEVIKEETPKTEKQELKKQTNNNNTIIISITLVVIVTLVITILLIKKKKTKQH